MEVSILNGYKIKDKKAIRFYDTVQDMKEDDTLKEGMHVRTKGYYSVNDGGASEYHIIATLSNSDYQEELENGLYASLIIENNTVNVKQFGAYGDGVTDDTSSIQNALNKSNTVFIPNGTYLITDTLINNDRINIIGESKFDTTLKFDTSNLDSEKSMLIISNTTSRNVIKNINFTSTYNEQDISEYENYLIIGLLLNSSSYNIIENCRFFQLKSGIRLYNSWCNNIENSYFGRCYIGIDSAGASHGNNIYVKTCQIEYNDIGVYFGEGRNQSLYNCDIENNRTNGVQKTNEGSIEIINSYFEDKILIKWGQTYVSKVLILGCTFFQNDTTAYTPIEFHGFADNTKVTIINCLFKNLSENSATYTTPAIKQTNDYRTVHPTLIDNSVYNMVEYDFSAFKGVRINSGKIESYHDRSFGTNFINASNGESTILTIDSPKQYRVNLGSSGTYTIQLPTVPTEKRLLEQEFEFIIAGTNSDSQTLTINITGDTGVTVYGADKTISISDKGKIVKAVYIGNFNSVDNWQIVK